MMDMIESLRDAGLSENEAKVYEALLNIGMTSAKGIIEETGLHRQLVYDSLDVLMNKGLASYVMKSGVRHFKASDPEQILNYFDKQEEEIREKKESFKQILPKLKRLREHIAPEQEVSLYRGKKGIETLLDDQLEQEEEILTIGASDIEAEPFRYHLREYLPGFHEEREEKGIPFKIILSEELENRVKKLDKLEHAQARRLPKEFTSNTSTMIYGNKVSIVMWGSQPFGILIKSKDIPEAQKKHFNILWEMAEKPE